MPGNTTSAPGLNCLGLSYLETSHLKLWHQENASPASSSVWPPLPPSIFVADVAGLLKKQCLHSFHVTYRIDLKGGKGIYFLPYGVLCLRPSYLHLCKANPGHWSPQALHGWPLSIRPSPVNFKTKRQHKRVHHQDSPQSPTCILGRKACPSHLSSVIGLNCFLMLGTWDQILPPGEGHVIPGGLSI